VRPLSELAPGPAPRAVYIDLDGTLLGPGGSLYASAEGEVTREAALAVAALLEAGGELVPLSGRTAVQVRETARLVGSRAYIAELGGLTCYEDGEVILNPGEFRGEGTPHEAMQRGGVGGLLLEAYPGRLEPHAPWAFLDRECSMLLRGHVDVAEAEAVLARAGFGWLQVTDNGVIRRGFPGLRTEEAHAYHVLPRGVSKAVAAAADMARRGLNPAACAAIGDSPADAALAEVCGAAFIVANGRDDVERGGVDAPNLYATPAPYGDGFAQAVTALLAR
jgi:hypothetical protein